MFTQEGSAVPVRLRSSQGRVRTCFVCRAGALQFLMQYFCSRTGSPISQDCLVTLLPPVQWSRDSWRSAGRQEETGARRAGWEGSSVHRDLTHPVQDPGFKFPSLNQTAADTGSHDSSLVLLGTVTELQKSKVDCLFTPYSCS